MKVIEFEMYTMIIKEQGLEKVSFGETWYTNLDLGLSASPCAVWLVGLASTTWSQDLATL